MGTGFSVGGRGSYVCRNRHVADAGGAISARKDVAKEGASDTELHHQGLLSGRGCSAPPATKKTWDEVRCLPCVTFTHGPLVVSAAASAVQPAGVIAPESTCCVKTRQILNFVPPSASYIDSPDIVDTYVSHEVLRESARGLAGPRHQCQERAGPGARYHGNSLSRAGSGWLESGSYGGNHRVRATQQPGFTDGVTIPTRPARNGNKKRKDVRADPRPATGF